MPGSVSDSYDPEFGTGSNVAAIEEVLEKLVNRINSEIGTELKNIIEVARGESGSLHTLNFSERELRFLRFGLNRALESL